MKVLLLGATGNLGRRTAAELLRTGKLEKLTIGSRSEAKARSLARLLGGDDLLVPARVDIEKPGDVAAHASEHSIVVSCAGPASALEVPAATAALEAGVSYVSASDSARALPELKALHDRAVERSVCIASGFGLSPGISNLLAVQAARGFDEVEQTDITMATASSEAPGDATLIDFFTNLGEPNEVGGTTGAPRQVYFPEPVGWIETFPCAHPEVVGMRGRGAGSVRFRIGLAERIGMDLVRAARAARILRTERGRRMWLAAAGPMRPLL
jgi:hypothetical protein